MIRKFLDNSFNPHNENSSIAGIYFKARILSLTLIAISALLALYIIVGLLYLFLRSDANVHIKIFITFISIIVAFLSFIGFEVGQLLYNYSNKLKDLLDTYVRLYINYGDDSLENRKIFDKYTIYRKRIYAEKFCKENNILK